MRRVVFGAVFALAFGSASIANADEALSLERQGDAAFDAKEWNDAAGAYEAAWVLTKKPELLTKLADAYEANQRYPEALDRLAAFASSAQASPELDARLSRLRERVAIVVVDTTVCDAEVRVRREVVGKTCGPSFKVNAGIARIEVQKAGHAPFAQTIELPATRTTTVAAPLRVLDEESILVVKSSVPGAHVAVAGRAAGTAPTELLVKPGSHAVVVAQDGYETRSVNAIVGAGERSDVHLHLEEEKTIADKWWFWTAVGLGLGTAIAATIVLVSDRDDASSGTIAPGRVSSGLRF